MHKLFPSSRTMRGFLVLTASALSTVPVLAQSATSRPIETILGQPGSDTLSPELIRQLPRHRLFTRSSGTDERITARRDVNVWSAVRSTRSRFVVEGFPLSTGAPVDLVLQPFRVTGPNTRFVIGQKGGPDIPFDYDPSRISLFRGSVVGRPGSHVYLAISDRISSGYIDLGPGRERMHISSKDYSGRNRTDGSVSVFSTSGSATASAGVPLCGTEDGMSVPDAKFPAHPAGGAVATAAGVTVPTIHLKHLELAVDTDFEFFSLFGDATVADDYLVAVYGAVSDIYMRDVNVRIELTFTRIWPTSDDLYNAANPLTEFWNHWEANETGVQRDAAQLLSGRRDLPFGGQAFVSQLCNFAYGWVGYAVGFFPDPTKPSPFNWDVSVTAHELGHNAGTLHTHDLGLDTCNNPNTTPRRGSIMSYCGQTWSGMKANTDNYFHTVVQNEIRNHVNISSCIVPDCNANNIDDLLDIFVNGTSLDVNGNSIPDECEDCNGNGVLDPTDIAGASNDLNNNGIPDECEPDCNGNGVPDDRDIASGTAIDLYGNGIPDSCEEDCNNNGTSDYSEIQLNMPLDVDRNARLDSCQDCDGDGIPDLDELNNAHSLWVATGLDFGKIREFHPFTGVRSDESLALVRRGQDVLVLSNGHVLVSSALDNRVMEFDESGNFVGSFVSVGAGGLAYPTGMLMLPDGRLLVSSRDTHSVLAFDGTTGASLGSFVAADAGGLVRPFGLTLGRNGDLFITSDNGEVLQYDGVTGAFRGVFVDSADNGGLSQPRGLVFKRDGNLLVASFGTDEVLEFEWPGGLPLGKWAQVGTATNITQDSPWGIRIGPNGHVYVSRTGTAFSSGPLNDRHEEDDDDVGQSHLTDARMFEFDVCTGLFRKTHIGGNDPGLFFATGFDFIPGMEIDCNFNQLTDDCDIASGTSLDTNGNGVPDECEIDCNGNGTFDQLDLIPFGTSFDCNCNGIPDECDVASGLSTDCNGDGRLDECEPDCNGNGEADGCDIDSGFSVDCDGNGVPDDCQADCNNNTVADTCDLTSGSSQDCNGNSVPDECDTIGGGVLVDVDFENGLPAGWTTSGIFQVTNQCIVPPVCNGSTWAYAGSTGSCSYGDNQIGQLVSPPIQLGPSESTLEFCSLVRTESGFDFCKVFVNGTEVFSEAGEAGVWQTETIDLRSFANQVITIAFVLASDGFVSGTLGWQVDNIRVGSGSADCNANTVPDECEPDEDCDGNGTRDICDIGDGTHADCNANLVPDPCDISSGNFSDSDGNGVLDVCENCLPASPPEPEMIGLEVSVKNRMLTIYGGNPGRSLAVRVEFVSLPPPHDIWNGARLWASQPFSVSQAGSELAPVAGFPDFKAAMLQCDGPEFMDLNAIGALNLFHEGIVPQGTYRVELLDSLCDADCVECYSPGLEITTARLGDTIRDCSTLPCPPPDGFVNVDDLLAVLGRFASVPLSIVKPRADIEPACLDLVINISDVLMAIRGFAGLPYALLPTAADACGSTCVSPIP